MDRCIQLVPCTIDCISDDQLLEIAFIVHVRRVAFLSTCSNIISDPVRDQVKYAAQVLWTLLTKSSHHIRRKFAQCISNESQLMISALKAMCTCLESKGESIGVSRASQSKPSPNYLTRKLLYWSLY